jgi:type II secretory pathway component PulJ
MFARLIVAVLSSGPGLVFLVLVLIFATRRYVKRRHRTSRTEVDPLLALLQRLLKQMDARIRKQQFQRRPGETLHQFAHRIAIDAVDESQRDAWADWYRQYATTRYSGDPQPEAVEALRQQLSSATP